MKKVILMAFMILMFGKSYSQEALITLKDSLKIKTELVSISGIYLKTKSGTLGINEIHSLRFATEAELEKNPELSKDLLNTGVTIYIGNDKLISIQSDEWAKKLAVQEPTPPKAEAYKEDAEIASFGLGDVIDSSAVEITFGDQEFTFDIIKSRENWFKTSYLLDKIQRPKGHADVRKKNIFNQKLEYHFQSGFNGKLSTYGIDPKRRKSTGLKAAIIREKGVNGDREMAYTLYLAGFDVKDVHMTDLVTGREDLSTINMIVFVGGFSNSDVLGSSKGWAGAFIYNPKAKAALDNFYAREDTLSLGVCNGCQLMMELGLINRDMEMSAHPKMHHNGSGKFESAFINLTIPKNNSIMLKSYEGARLGAWLAHGEGLFQFPEGTSLYNVATTYSHTEYPGNPNDSDFAVAALCSKDGRHLAIMPHIERSLFPWNWPYYTRSKQEDEIGPWMEAFVNAREWVKIMIGR